MKSDTVTDTSTQSVYDDEGDVYTTPKIHIPDTSSQECKKVGRFAHPSSCTKYYFCWQNFGTPYEFNCPEHRAFDPISQHCVVNYGVCAIAPKCNNDKQIITNPDDKWSFFECFLKQNETNAFELHCKRCADDRQYDDKLGYCKVASANGEMTLDSDESTDDSMCGETGLLIDYEDDTKYYECVVKSVTKGLGLYQNIHLPEIIAVS